MRRRRMAGAGDMLLFGMAVLCLIALGAFGLREQLFCLVYPGISYIAGGASDENELCKLIAGLSFGYYGYAKNMEKPVLQVENRAGAMEFLSAGELAAEKTPLWEEDEGKEEAGTDLQDKEEEIPGNEGLAGDSTMDDIFLSEDEAQEIEKENERLRESKVFVKAGEQAVTLDYEKLLDDTYLRKHFYTVDSTTTVTKQQIDARRMLEYDAAIRQDASAPQILIYHTHSQEAFADSRPGESADTIVGVGEKLAGILREEYGFYVLHDTGAYDVENRDYAYSAAAPAIERILAENPSIEVIIDLHRDGVSDATRLVSNVGGRTTAQFMFFNGVSYLNSKGPVDYLENPYIEQNLAFSFQMKLKCDEYYPGFARNTYIKGLRYNMHYREKSLLIEVGAQTNTVEEAMNAAEPLAHVISMVLKGE